MNFELHQTIIGLMAKAEALHLEANGQPNRRKAAAIRRKAKRAEADAEIYRCRQALESC